MNVAKGTTNEVRQMERWMEIAALCPGGSPRVTEGCAIVEVEV